MVEHSGHMVPEGGYDMIPKYVFDGCLLAGETAGLCMNMDYQVRGMDFAVASGQMAAKAAVEALDTVNVDEALSVNKYEVDEETPHIVLAEDLKSSPRGALLVNDSSLARALRAAVNVRPPAFLHMPRLLAMPPNHGNRSSRRFA